MSDYIPEEILIKIFLYLPPKPLIGLRCVCKSWHSLIARPDFISEYNQRNLTNANKDSKQTIVRHYSKAQNSEVYSVHADDEDFTRLHDVEIGYPFLGQVRYYYRIVGSYNGVLCLSNDLFGPLGCVVLWNPVIRRKVKLSLPRETDDDASPSSFVLGFGFDARSNDYKVVKLAYALNEEVSRVFPVDAEVYALSTGNWHKIDGDNIPAQNCIVDYFWSQVFVDGNVHWIAYKWNEAIEAENEEIESLIMTFDVAGEVFDEIQLPDPLRYELPMELNVTSLEGSVSVVHYRESRFSVWAVKKNHGGEGPSWSKQYTVDDVAVEMVLGFRADYCLLFTSEDGRLNSYDPFTREREDLGISGTKRSFCVGPYVESLELLREGTVALVRIDEGDDEDDDEYGDEDADEDVDKSEFWMRASVSQYLAALLS